MGTPPALFHRPSSAAQFAQHLVYYSSDRFEYISNTIWLIVFAGAGLYMAVVRGRDTTKNSWWSARKEVVFLLVLLIVEWRWKYWGKRHA
ncbi:MAG: hypothetical protein MR654_12270 [Corynebacterium glucuronolyticum]|nr:hypothetical protein [Corynebacterium glucuronolyticum]